MQKISYQGHMGPAEEVADFLSFIQSERDNWDYFQIKVIASSGCLNGDISVVVMIVKDKDANDGLNINFGADPGYDVSIEQPQVQPGPPTVEVVPFESADSEGG